MDCGENLVRNSLWCGRSMKDLISKANHLYVLLTEDLCELTGFDLSKDLSVIEHRSNHEGLPFLTLTLPKFGDAFFRSLNEGMLQPCTAFAMKGALPKFLSGLTSRVFDAETGVLLKDPCYVSAYCIRQICYLLYKMEVPYSEEQRRSALDKMLQCERQLGGLHFEPHNDKVLLLAQSLIEEILGRFQWSDTNPRQGPGACNSGVEDPWEKWHFIGDGEDNIPDEVFSTPGLAAAGINSDPADIIAWLGGSNHQVRDVRQSKVSLVPKNSKGPRVISAEAYRMMWCQLGIDDLIRRRIAQHSYVRNQIAFKDQEVNAKLALCGSQSQDWATIDLSEASDRVSTKLIRLLFPVSWVRAIDETRATSSVLPDQSVIGPLEKVAPMGNGYCFSVESLVFWAICSASIAASQEGIYTSERTLENSCHNTYAYGDDIVVPTQYALTVMEALERYGFRVNRDKSFWTGPFRESCGTDAFNGVDITPLRIKVAPRTDKLEKKTSNERRRAVDANFVASWAEQSKDWKHMLPRVSAWMESEVYNHLGTIPTYPEGWKGCIGVPVAYEKLKGKRYRAGERMLSGPFRKVIGGPAGQRKRSFSMIIEDEPAPSDGMLIKIWRVKSVSVTAPLEPRNGHLGFSEELGYLRWLQSCAGRKVVDEPFDPRTFELRYTSKVSVTREWVS